MIVLTLSAVEMEKLFGIVSFFFTFRALEWVREGLAEVGLLLNKYFIDHRTKMNNMMRHVTIKLNTIKISYKK